MARQPHRLAGARGAARGVRVRRGRDLRRRRQLRARLPARDRHRQAGQGAARAQHARARASRSRCGSPGAGRRSSARRAPGCAPATPGRVARARDARRQPGGATGGQRASWCPSGPRPCRARRPRSCRRRHAGGRRRRLPAGLRQPDLRPRASGAATARACPRRWSRSRRAPGCRCGSPTTSPGTAARRRGPRRATRRARGGWPTTPSTRCGAGATAGGCRSSATRARARSGSPQEAVGLLSEVNAERHGKLEIVDSIAWAHERLLPRLTPGRKLGSVVVHPTCASRHLELDAALAAIAATLADEVVVPLAATCCGFGRRPRPAASRARRRRPPPSRPPSSPARSFDAAPVLQPHLRDRPRAGDRAHLRVVRLRARRADAVARRTGDHHGKRLTYPSV